MKPIAYINVEKRTLEFAKNIFWHTPTVANLDRIPLYTKEALAQTQEPVAWMYQEYRDDDQFGWRDEILFTPPPNDPIYFRNITPVYDTTPPQRTEQEPVGDDWTPCMKLPVVVYVRKQRLGESHVSTREGITPVKPDDLIMRGVSGEEYPIGRAIFEQTYSLNPAPPQRTEQNFCSRCGKRVGGIDSIHTCTPPMEKNT
jgi:hypothetical protein